jgi:hypothetical protein
MTTQVPTYILIAHHHHHHLLTNKLFTSLRDESHKLWFSAVDVVVVVEKNTANLINIYQVAASLKQQNPLTTTNLVKS